MKHCQTLFIVCLSFLSLPLHAGPIGRVASPDGRNVIMVSLNDGGEPFYRVEHGGRTVVEASPLGLRCENENLSSPLKLHHTEDEKLCPQKYHLLVGNKLSVDTAYNMRRFILSTPQDSELTIELAAGDQGVAFRYLFGDHPRRVVEELTGFKIAASARGWLQPYHAAGPYTPAYEDFYLSVRPLEQPGFSRAKARGWSLPGLFHVPDAQSWILIAESGLDDNYCASHLQVIPGKGIYQVALAYEDEITGARTFHADAKQAPVLTSHTPWRVIVIGDAPADIANSTLVTDLALPSQIEDTSWIKPGRASWSWWSHPEDKDTNELYNSFTELASSFGWEYTLFDAGWWNADLDAISAYANAHNVKPLIWMHAGDFYDAEKRQRKLDDLISKGIKGIKVDFWCSDRQETMAAMLATLRDAAERKLVVSFHGCTIPRGWHRTWPNLLTAEAVLGTECYFYESTYPDKVARLSTLLPFTRNAMAPVDITPFAQTIRKYTRKTTAAFELATCIVFNSGIIHFADSVEVFRALPNEPNFVLKEIPAVWDETVYLEAKPGECVVVARRTGSRWFIAGLSGTNEPNLVSLNLERFGTEGLQITEGKDPVVDFAIKKIESSNWQHQIPPRGGFVLVLKPR